MPSNKLNISGAAADVLSWVDQDRPPNREGRQPENPSLVELCRIGYFPAQFLNLMGTASEVTDRVSAKPWETASESVGHSPLSRLFRFLLSCYQPRLQRSR